MRCVLFLSSKPDNARCSLPKPSGANPAPAGDAFEDVLYGSESEVDDSDDEQQAPPKRGRSMVPKKKGVDHTSVRLRVDDDEPMDLLQGVASRITGMSSLLEGGHAQQFMKRS